MAIALLKRNDQDSGDLNKPVEQSLKISEMMLAFGFSLILAWHYLVLFSPVFTSDNGDGLFGYLLERQLTLYLSIAAAFTVIAAVKTQARKKGKQLRFSPMSIYAAGIFAVAASASCVILPVTHIELFLIAIALLGISEAILMFLWLNTLTRFDAKDMLKKFAIYMMLGGFLALIVCCLNWPFSVIAAIAAPGLSALILARKKQLDKAGNTGEPSDLADTRDSGNLGEASESAPDSSGEDSEPRKNDSHESVRITRWKALMTTSICVYALAFGMLQGAFAVADVTLLMVENPIVLLGIILASLIIYLIPNAFGRSISIDLMHRYSLLLFVIGAAAVGWFHIGEGFLVVSQIAILAGFNLYDFGVMAHGIVDKQNGTENSVRPFEGGRPIVYPSLAIGLGGGYLLAQGTPPYATPQMLTAICGAAIVLLVATTLIPFYSFLEITKEDADEGEVIDLPEQCPNVEIAAANSFASSARQAPPEDWISPWKSACTQIAKLYQLSPRETEIFFLIAKGRNADYVQQNLVISMHTAKTHIANIYRKLEVHSSQELLDLVEAFRDAERRLAESEDEQILS